MASSMRRALSALKIVSGVFNFMVDVAQVPRPIFPVSLIGGWLSSVCYRRSVWARLSALSTAGACAFRGNNRSLW